jgi:SAM-dependent methyltransferase
MRAKRIKQAVKERYAKIAKENISCCTTCAPCGTDVIEQAKAIGYSEQELKSIPESAIMGLGCGNPIALANLKSGEIVLDLGAGAGIDVFLAANKVGEKGRVIGVDMTPEMNQKGAEIAKKNGYKNVEFRLGEIENLPIDDNSIDVIISNCVINLSPDKLKTYQEGYRVLKPNGRILVSDLVTQGKLPRRIRESFDAWAGCIAGALEKNDYISTIKQAGFRNVRIISQTSFYQQGMPKILKGKVMSIKVEAYKPV